MKDIVYIATDRTPASRLNIYGGYNIYPNLERLAENGTVYENAVACAASTIMCHTSEWLGDYTWNHRKGVPHKKRLYEANYGHGESLFTDLVKMGYDVHLIFMARKNTETGVGKYYYTYKQTASLWPEEAFIHVYHDYDMPEQKNKSFSRKDHVMKVADCLEQSRKRGRPAFVWIKMHGCYRWGIKTKPDYTHYAGQYRPTANCTYNAENDEAIGALMGELGYGESEDCPEIWFGSDHGAFSGQNSRAHYGYHLYNEIVHVPLICSKKVYEQGVVKDVFSMKELRRLLTRDNSIGLPGHNFKEKYVFAETLYSGQVPKKPGTREAMAKIMVRKGRFKYIYSAHGPDGFDLKPSEELFDLEFDPVEKINLLEPFVIKWRDSARRNRDGRPGTKVFSRHAMDTDKYGSGHYSGWSEILEVAAELREQARKIWKKSGREKYFRPVRLK